MHWIDADAPNARGWYVTACAKHGPIKAVAALRRVLGIVPKTLTQRVHRCTPVDTLHNAI
jgi:hypothetical protein